MLHELALVQELQIAALRGWQLHTGLRRETRELRGLGLGWQQNQHQGNPSSQSLVKTAESRAQPAWHFVRLIVLLPA
jgi:hypothetical protein